MLTTNSRMIVMEKHPLLNALIAQPMLPRHVECRRQLFARVCVIVVMQMISAQVIPGGQSVHQEAITKRNVSVSWLISAQLTPPELRARVTTRTSAHAKTSSAKARLTTPASMAMTSRHAPVRSLAEERWTPHAHMDSILILALVKLHRLQQLRQLRRQPGVYHFKCVRRLLLCCLIYWIEMRISKWNLKRRIVFL